MKTITIERPTASEANGRLKAASATQTTIGAQAFAECTELTTAVISEQVASIGDEAFLNDSKLRIIYLLSETPPTLGNDRIKGVADDCVIYVPEGSEDEYKSAGLSGYDVRGHDVTGIKDTECLDSADTIVSVYDLGGNPIYQGTQDAMSLRPGLYIVNSAGRTRKMTVK